MSVRTRGKGDEGSCCACAKLYQTSERFGRLREEFVSSDPKDLTASSATALVDGGLQLEQTTTSDV